MFFVKWIICIAELVYRILWLLFKNIVILFQSTESPSEFTPVVTATCKTGLMSIKVTFNQPFNGVAHAREFRYYL